MKQFQKIELWLCFIPGLSSLFITIVTMFVFKKYRAGFLYWFLFALIFFGGGFLAYLVPNVILVSGVAVLEYLSVYLILTGMNALFVELQGRCTSVK